MTAATIRTTIQRIAGFVAILSCWQILAHVSHSPMLPDVPSVAYAFGPLLWSGELLQHAVVSVWTVLLGFGAAVTCGITLGVLIARSALVSATLTPAIDALRPVAALSFFPLLILLFGIGQTSKAIVIFWTAWPPILLATVHGLATVDVLIVEAATIDGANRARILRYITFPLALPAILTGLRIGMSAGWIGIVSAEMLGASAGLGYAVLSYSQSFQFPSMYAAIVMIAVCGLALNQSLLALQTLVERKCL